MHLQQQVCHVAEAVANTGRIKGVWPLDPRVGETGLGAPHHQSRLVSEQFRRMRKLAMLLMTVAPSSVPLHLLSCVIFWLAISILVVCFTPASLEAL